MIVFKLKKIDEISSARFKENDMVDIEYPRGLKA